MSARHPRRPAAIARVAATGLSAAGVFAIIGVMAAPSHSTNTNNVVDPSSVTDPPVTDASVVETAPDSVVVIEVHRTVYVDENGNPVDPHQTIPPNSTNASHSTTGTTVKSGGSSGSKATTSTSTTTVGGSTAGSTAPRTTVPSTTVPRPTTTKPKPPPCSGSKCP